MVFFPSKLENRIEFWPLQSNHHHKNTLEIKDTFTQMNNSTNTHRNRQNTLTHKIHSHTETQSVHHIKTRTNAKIQTNNRTERQEKVCMHTNRRRNTHTQTLAYKHISNNANSNLKSEKYPGSRRHTHEHRTTINI